MLADDTVQRVPLLYMQFNNAMRNKYAAHVDFRDFVGVISSNKLFLPSNVDMMAERHGSFFIGEWKKPNEAVSEGQKFLLKAQARVRNNTVVVINGSTDGPVTYVGDFFRVTDKGTTEKIGEGLPNLIKYYQHWYEYA